MDPLFRLETIVIELLLIISIAAIIIQRMRVPYTVALVAVGLGLTLIGPAEIETVELTEELILALFVPPLVFEAAFHINYTELKRNITPILTMAIPGVLITMIVVGIVMRSFTSISWEMALVFGALIAATDPVSIIALFRSLGAPKRLSLLVEGESLSNDGIAIVLFNLMLGIALTGEFHFAEGVLDFISVSFGGLAIGVGVGYVVAWLIARVDDHLIEITLTTVAAFGSYLLAEELHFSGVLAVVAAGLLNGNYGQRGMSPTTTIILVNFWEYIAFLANSFIFLLIGIEVNLEELLEDWQAIAVGIVAVMAARVIVVYGLGTLADRFGPDTPLKYKHVMVWGGLRGAISLALVLSIPAAVGPERDLVRHVTFGLVLFMLFFQGMTIGPLLRWLGLIGTSSEKIEYETRHARLATLQAANRHLDDLYHEGTISSYTWNKFNPEVETEIGEMKQQIHDLLEEQPDLVQDEFKRAQSEMLRAKRSALLELRHEGVISQTAFEILAVEIDGALKKIESH